jgi:hypothetical protein
MALCISYLSPWRIAKEGLGNGYEGSGSMLLHVRAFWMGFPGLAFGVVHISTCLVQTFGGGLCECGPLAGNVCVIHTIPNSLPLLPDPGPHHNNLSRI